jgi:transposase
LSTKIHIVVDALGNVLRLLYTAGQMHESTQAEALIAGLSAENLIGDKAFDSRVSERMCKQVSVSLPYRGDSHDDQVDDYTGTAGSTAC